MSFSTGIQATAADIDALIISINAESARRGSSTTVGIVARGNLATSATVVSLNNLRIALNTIHKISRVGKTGGVAGNTPAGFGGVDYTAQLANQKLLAPYIIAISNDVAKLASQCNCNTYAGDFCCNGQCCNSNDQACTNSATCVNTCSCQAQSCTNTCTCNLVAACVNTCSCQAQSCANACGCQAQVCCNGQCCNLLIFCCNAQCCNTNSVTNCCHSNALGNCCNYNSRHDCCDSNTVTNCCNAKCCNSNAVACANAQCCNANCSCNLNCSCEFN